MVERAPSLLTDIGFPLSKIPHVIAAIREHQPIDTPTSLEATLLRDADILEQLGAIGILRTSAKLGSDSRFHRFADVQSYLEKQLNSLPAKLQLPRARELAEPRIETLRSFLTSLAVEAVHDLH